MPFRRKLIFLIVGLVIALLTPYFLWHEQMDGYFESESYHRWLLSIRPFAWLIGLALIVGDLILPIPTPPVMATLGAIYGTLVGGLIASLGSVMAGVVAYGLARLLGRRGAHLLASDEEMAGFRRFFESWGAAGIVASRALPVLPEVLTLLAGLAGMHFGRFLLSLLLGSMPVGFLMAWAGQKAGFSSTLLLVLTLIPAMLWVIYLLFAGRFRGPDPTDLAPSPDLLSNARGD